MKKYQIVRKYMLLLTDSNHSEIWLKFIGQNTAK